MIISLELPNKESNTGLLIAAILHLNFTYIHKKKTCTFTSYKPSLETAYIQFADSNLHWMDSSSSSPPYLTSPQVYLHDHEIPCISLSVV